MLSSFNVWRGERWWTSGKTDLTGDLGTFQIVFDQNSQLYRDELCTEADLVMRGGDKDHSATGHSSSPAGVENTEETKRPIELDEIIMS